jgi:hypothetical protein
MEIVPRMLSAPHSNRWWNPTFWPIRQMKAMTSGSSGMIFVRYDRPLPLRALAGVSAAVRGAWSCDPERPVDAIDTRIANCVVFWAAEQKSPRMQWAAQFAVHGARDVRGAQKRQERGEQFSYIVAGRQSSRSSVGFSIVGNRFQ